MAAAMSNMQARCQSLLPRVPRTTSLLRAAQASHRAYATSTPPEVVKNPLQRKRGGDLGVHLPRHVVPTHVYIPPYPYGDHVLFKQANRGLYGEQMIQFGNNVSEKTETKTRRDFKPNVLSKSLYSVALKKKIKLRVTAKVLKTMDREGGLDEYLLKGTERRLKELGPLGWALRWTLLQNLAVIARMRADATALGLDQATIDNQWPTPEMLADRAQFGMVKASDLIGKASKPQSDDEAELVKNAQREYMSSNYVATRYLSRGVVTSREDGIKLAFIRADVRATLRSRAKERLREWFSVDDVKEARSRLNLGKRFTNDEVRKKAWPKFRDQQLKKYGSYVAWKAAIGGEKAEEYAQRLEQHRASHEETIALKKAEYAKAIAEAENAAADDSLDHRRRVYLIEAIRKANRAIQAHEAGSRISAPVERKRIYSRERYAEAVLDEYREEKGTGDAWKAIVDSSKDLTQDSAAAWRSIANKSMRASL